MTITASQDSVTEGRSITFTVTSDYAGSSALTVKVRATQSGSFISGTTPTSVTIGANQTTASFTVRTDDDSVDESNGSVTASILSGTGYDVGSTATITAPVIDNDGSSTTDDPEITISSSQTSVTEGQSIRFTVTADTAPSSKLAVSVQLTDSGAFLDHDETLRPTVTMPANRTSVSFTVGTDDDSVDESNGSITARLWVGTGYDVGSSYSVSVTVEDDDEPVSQTPGGTWSTTLTSAFDSQSNEYGYWSGEYGTLSDRTFEYDGVIYTVLYTIWHQPSSKIEFRVDRCLKRSEFVSLSIDSTMYSSPSNWRYSDAQCDADSTLDQEFEFNNVRSNPLSSGTSYLITIAFTKDAITPAVTVEADTQEPFVGQSVKMTASTPASFGAVSSYQWQEWSNGQWTNLASATMSSQAITSSVSGVRAFRVAVTNASSKTEHSSPVVIQWKPMTITVTASPDNPESGDASKRKVTLTATADAPTGVTYQWQQDNGSSWTNLGAATASASKTVSFTTRGTRKFRVQVSHAVVPSVKSEPTYVTWDEWDIVGDLMSALHASTTADTSYTTAQTSLLSCMNGGYGGASDASGAASIIPTPSFTSFDAILNSYTGTTKADMDAGGVCSPQATTMFSTNQTVSRSKLASLKAANSEYAALLETPQGQDFEEDLADPDTLKLVSYLGANVDKPGMLQAPLYASSGQKGSTTPPGANLQQDTGLACLPNGVDGARLTLDNKLRVLNCLVFATPHDFWVKGSGTRDAEQLKSAIDSSTGQFAWLKRGDWRCTFPAPQGPVPSCLKHDVAYGSLQKLAGKDASASIADDPNGAELDEAWNPRNKALADYKFRADIERWGCQDQTGLLAGALCAVPSDWIAGAYFWGVAERNHKGWPATSRDIHDVETHAGFINCTEPVVPEARNVNITQKGRTFKVSWDFVPGCVSTTLADVWFDVEWGFVNYPTEPAIRRGAEKCSVDVNRLTCSYTLNHPPPGTTVTNASIYVVPRDREHGGSNYGGEGLTGRRSSVSGHYVLN